MTYTVTAKRRTGIAKLRPTYSSMALHLPTLDEARAEVARAVHGYSGWIGSDYISLRITECGGTVGPLPDGSVIEVTVER